MLNPKKVLFLTAALFLLIAGLGAADYHEVLQMAVRFFDANKCGPDAAVDNVFDWRGACHTRDGHDVEVDLTGGLHDAGDHVKFGQPQGYTASILGWALYEFKPVFDQAGITPKLLSTLKYMTDYFLRSYVSGRFYYQVGEGEADHTYWGAPEDQDPDRITYAWADASTPASDVLGITSSALSLMYLNYRGIDPAYAAECLDLARVLYDMARTNLGKGDGQSFYASSSCYDDLSWAATWMYVIDGEESSLARINDWLQNPNTYGDVPLKENHWTMCWDDIGLAVLTKLAMLTGDNLYMSVVEDNLEYWLHSINSTPGGLGYLSNWGVLRYASAEAMIACLYGNYTGNSAYYDFARSQIDYILGDNPADMSYIVGYGDKYALHPHHRAANGYTYANGDNQKPAKYLLSGALVGGPDQNDQYLDDVNQYQYTEVAIDYNASFIGGLAACMYYADGPVVTPTLPPVTPTPYDLKGDTNGDTRVTIIDALMTAQAHVGLIDLDATARIRADVDCDGRLTIIDALQIAQYAVGLLDNFC